MESAYVALAHKVHVGFPTTRVVDRPGGTDLLLRHLADALVKAIAGDGVLLRLDYVQGAPNEETKLPDGPGYATAVFSSRTGALAAIEHLDCLPVEVAAASANTAAELATFKLRWSLKWPVLRMLDLSPEVKAEDFKQAMSSLAEVEAARFSRDLSGVQGTHAVVTFKHRGQAADVQRQLALNLFMLAGYAIPVQAAFEHGALDDDFDPLLLQQAETLDPDRPADSSTSRLAAGAMLCWPDDMVLLGGSLVGNTWGAPGAMLVPRAHPDLVAAVGSSEPRLQPPAEPLADADFVGSADARTSATTAERSARSFSHCGVRITVSIYAPPRDVTKDGHGKLLLTTALPLPRAAARLAATVSQQPRFAQPGSLEFDFAFAWRRLQDMEAVERSRLAMEQEERRAELLAAQRAEFEQASVILDGVEMWRKTLLNAAAATGAEVDAAALRAALDALKAHAQTALSSQTFHGDDGEDRGAAESLAVARFEDDDFTSPPQESPASSPLESTPVMPASSFSSGDLPMQAEPSTSTGFQTSQKFVNAPRAAGATAAITVEDVVPSTFAFAAETSDWVEQAPDLARSGTLRDYPVPPVAVDDRSGDTFFQQPRASLLGPPALPYYDAPGLVNAPCATAPLSTGSGRLAPSQNPAPPATYQAHNARSEDPNHVGGSLLGSGESAATASAPLVYAPADRASSNISQPRYWDEGRGTFEARGAGRRPLSPPPTRQSAADTLRRRSTSRSRSPPRETDRARTRNGSNVLLHDFIRNLQEPSARPVVTGRIASDPRARGGVFFFVDVDANCQHVLPVQGEQVFVHQTEVARADVDLLRKGALVKITLAPSPFRRDAFCGTRVQLL